jgi:hypothetical protein
MKTIQEAGPSEVAAIKRRTIRTLAMGEISEKDCDFINNHLDAITSRLETISNKEGDK